MELMGGMGINSIEALQGNRLMEAVDGDDVCAAAGDAAGDGGDVVDGGHLDDNRLFVFSGLLEGIDQLP